MEPTKYGFKLSTGKEFYANRSILGLSPELGEYRNRLYITEGYDGGVAEDRAPSEYSENPPFTSEERHEIAEYMAALWRQWAEQPPEKSA